MRHALANLATFRRDPRGEATRLEAGLELRRRSLERTLTGLVGPVPFAPVALRPDRRRKLVSGGARDRGVAAGRPARRPRVRPDRRWAGLDDRQAAAELLGLMLTGYVTIARARRPFSYVPFGGGPRLCRGRTIALLESTPLLARISQRFDVAAAGPLGRRPHAGLNLALPSGLPVRVLERGAASAVPTACTGRP